MRVIVRWAFLRGGPSYVTSSRGILGDHVARCAPNNAMIGRKTPLGEARFFEAKTLRAVLLEMKKGVSSSCRHVIDVHLTRSPLGGSSQSCASTGGCSKVPRRVPSVAVQLFRDSRDADASPRDVEFF